MCYVAISQLPHMLGKALYYIYLWAVTGKKEWNQADISGLSVFQVFWFLGNWWLIYRDAV